MQLDNMEEVKLLMLEIENLFMDLDEKKKEIESRWDYGINNNYCCLAFYSIKV